MKTVGAFTVLSALLLLTLCNAHVQVGNYFPDGLRVGSPSSACNESSHGLLRFSDNMLQVCNGNNATWMEASSDVSLSQDIQAKVTAMAEVMGSPHALRNSLFCSGNGVYGARTSPSDPFGSCSCYNDGTRGHWTGLECEECAVGYDGDDCTVLTNPCAANVHDCDQTCLLDSPGVYSCQCGSNYVLDSDLRSCLSLGSHASYPAPSCKSILQAFPGSVNGPYFVYNAGNSGDAVETYCDMSDGGWTLIGKMSGKPGNIASTWLHSKVNAGTLTTPTIPSPTTYACFDAVNMAVNSAAEIMFSSGDVSTGHGSKWVRWSMPAGRTTSTWWNQDAGHAVILASGTSTVTVSAYTGGSSSCHQNIYGIMPLYAHGGSFPYAAQNPEGNTSPNDWCMAVGTMVSGDINGFEQNLNGFDAPSSFSDWPNANLKSNPSLTVWLR